MPAHMFACVRMCLPAWHRAILRRQPMVVVPSRVCCLLSKTRKCVLALAGGNTLMKCEAIMLHVMMLISRFTGLSALT